MEELETHGGSLRIYGCHDEETKRIDPSVAELIQRETEFGLQNLNIYSQFHIHAETIKNQLLKFLIEQKEKGKTVVLRCSSKRKHAFELRRNKNRFNFNRF